MTEQERQIFNRSLLLMGNERMERIMQMRIIVFGVGGVGSWCAESLVRNGIRHLTLVDSDVVCISNCNRQLMATTRTIGRPKVEALRERLLEINPEADIATVEGLYNEDTAESFHLEQYDVVIDAIDSLREKAHLILHTTRLAHKQGGRPTLLSSMGAALKTDPTKVRVAEFWKVQGDPLARALRNRFKRDKTMPSRKFMCVYSEEPALPNAGASELLNDGSMMFNKVQANGSLSHITGIFGLTLAGLAVHFSLSTSRTS